MAKSISLQLKEALEQVDALSAQIALATKDQDAVRASAEAKATELAEAHKSISDLTGKLADATKRDAELCQDLANAKAEIERLNAEAQSVTETAAQEAQRIVADIGVPAVDADADAKPGADKSLADLTAEYAELLKADTRAAGEFYTNKLAPALRKETK